jgi:phosphoribosyl 1,2-cyclic phosphodiesterase
MKLSIIATGSKANGYILQNEKEALIIEVGAPLLDYKKALDFNTSKVCGVLVSHQHNDHSKYFKDFCKAGFNVYSGGPTIEALRIESHRAKKIQPNKAFLIGSFKVLAFEVKHDVYNLGFVISHKETGNILFITDTYMIPYDFKNISHAIIESNYIFDKLQYNMDTGQVNTFLGNRIIKSHLEFNRCLNFIEKLNNLKTIVLIHLSFMNSDPEFMLEGLKKFNCKSVIAESGGVVEL